MKESIFIILGATGDLTKRKLIPAIYKLVEDKKIDKFAIIGTAFTDTNMDKVLGNTKKFIPKINNKIWKRIKTNSYYYQLDFYDAKGYSELKKLIKCVIVNH